MMVVVLIVWDCSVVVVSRLRGHGRAHGSSKTHRESSKNVLNSGGETGKHPFEQRTGSSPVVINIQV